jgi:NADH-quinone oxidoreductase subunit C
MTAPAVKTELPSEEKALVDSLLTLGDKCKITYSKYARIKILVPRENIEEVVRYAKDQLHFDHLENLTATDFPKDKQIEVVYHFGSIDGPSPRRIVLGVSCRVPENDPVLPSLVQIFPGVNYQERVTAEMVGVVFQGHPNLTRFVLPEDWADIPPLLKSYRLPGRLEGE